MKTCIFSKPLKKLTTQELSRVRKLTLVGPSAMRDVLNDCDYDEYEKEGVQVFIAGTKVKKIIAWSMVLPYYNYIDISKYRVGSGIYLYVEENFRRQGVGSQLLKRSIRYAKRKASMVRVHPWDGNSASFFETVSKKTALKMVYR